ncbi:hypothetical protein JCM30237_29710 [Halolamina litorea]|uniref:Permease n=1 Tax=Halolamina litorea TaxID=1515593 RepID=A0ABD6BT00_9EURY|nr:permease [Halolamina litorea]
MGIFTTLGHAIGATTGMAWDTWWALVLGFTITGAIEVFTTEEQMTEYLGDDGWREVGYGTLFGVASSSCSYSAVSTAKTLFKKGASPTAAFGAFMFAATDLVIELGLVMWVLLGWKFVLAEFVGGLIVIVLLTLIYRRVPDHWWDEAYENLLELDETECPACGMAAPPHDEETVETEYDGETLYFCCGGCLNAWEAMNDADAKRVKDDEPPGLLSKSGWRRAASNSVREWDMLWDDIAIGFIIAGFVTAFVPSSWWLDLFQADSSGLLWVTYGAIIGVFIATVTFVCSVGNIPFALVLWTNGLPFGAVLSFIYADMVIPPIVNTYRKYYGMRIAMVLFAAMASASVVAGVIVHYLFMFTSLIPVQGTAGGTAPDTYTVWLNIAFTALFVAQLTASYGRDVIGDTVLDTIGVLGSYYYRFERTFGTATANYGRFKGVMEALSDVFGTAASAAGDVAGETADTLEREEEKLKPAADDGPDGTPATGSNGSEPYDHRRASGTEPGSGASEDSVGRTTDPEPLPDGNTRNTGSSAAVAEEPVPAEPPAEPASDDLVAGARDGEASERDDGWDEDDSWEDGDWTDAEDDDTGAFQFAGEDGGFEFGDPEAE